LRDVACDLGRANDAAFRILDRGHGERDVDSGAVLATSDGLKVINPLASSDARQDFAFLAPQLGRDQQRDRLADHLGRRIAEDAFGAFIPGGDDAVEVLADDGIVGGLDDRGEKRLPDTSPLVW
jgi:hypothetical protein